MVCTRAYSSSTVRCMSRPVMASSGLLAGKRCLVTGGSRGIGKAIAETFAREGASLALVATNKSKLEEVADSCKAQGAPDCEVYPFDLVNTDDIDSLAKRILQDKQVDVLVNNAGIMVPGSAYEGDRTDWERCIKLNVLAPMVLTHAFAPGMVERKDGLIINVASIAGVEPMKSTPVYAASKWGLRGWSLSCYEALRQENVKVVSINPAAVATDMTEGNLQGKWQVQAAVVCVAKRADQPDLDEVEALSNWQGDKLRDRSKSVEKATNIYKDYIDAHRDMSSGKLLAGKWCIVTGGGKGIGAAIAETFAAEGANIALVARSKDALEKVATYSVDLGDLAALDKFAKTFQNDHKHCDVLVNSAGVMSQGSPAEGDISQWQQCIQLNLLAPMALTHAFTPAMVEKKEGLIINPGSVAGLEPMKATPVYAASKWGIRGWSLSCYEAFRQHNVKVVCIHPAAVHTPMTEGKFIAERCLKPSDVAEAAMLAVRTSSACVPQEITLRLTLSAAKRLAIMHKGCSRSQT